MKATTLITESNTYEARPLKRHCPVIQFSQYRETVEKRRVAATPPIGSPVVKPGSDAIAGGDSRGSMRLNTQACDKEDAVLVAQAIKELPYVTQAYEALVRRHYTLIYRICLRILKDADEAEDGSQIVLLKVFNGLPRFQGNSTFKTWLTKITTHTCFTRYKTLKIERERTTNLTETEREQYMNENTGSPEFLWQDSVADIVCGLTKQDQQIINLRFVSDLSLVEIAVTMTMGLSATKMRFYRALRKLKERM